MGRPLLHHPRHGRHHTQSRAAPLHFNRNLTARRAADHGLKVHHVSYHGLPSTDRSRSPARNPAQAAGAVLRHILNYRFGVPSRKLKAETRQESARLGQGEPVPRSRAGSRIFRCRCAVCAAAPRRRPKRADQRNLHILDIVHVASADAHDFIAALQARGGGGAVLPHLYRPPA